MYAVFEDGSRQYRVTQGDRVRIDHREADLGSRIELGRVLMYSNGDDTRIGTPAVDGVRVVGVVVGHPSTKTYIQKFRRRKNSRRLTGHRQRFVELEIKHILMPGEEAPAEEENRPPASEGPPETPAPEDPGTPAPEEKAEGDAAES